MSDIFISYARSVEPTARKVAEGLKTLGYGVWRDDQLPPHRPYAEVIEERLRLAAAVLVIWSVDAAKSHWVRSEANRGRSLHKLVQMRIDETRPPMPFDQLQCVNLVGWTGDPESPAWRAVVASLAELLEARTGPPPMPMGTAPADDIEPAPTGKPSIAVMPFANLSGDADQAYFADGMVEEIITALSKIRSIFVIASGSSLSFRGRSVEPAEAARDLGVRYVLEGSVRRAAGRVRITVRLIDALGRAQIWADRFDDDMEDVFALQDRVALAVAGVIEPRVQHVEMTRAAGRYGGRMGGYDLYLRALALYRTGDGQGVLDALDLLDRALDLDPGHGLALGLAAVCRRDLALSGASRDPGGDRRMAVELADRALRAAGDDAEVLAFAGATLGALGHDVDAVLALFDRAIALNPGSSTAWLSSGMMRLRAGDPDRAADHIEASMRLDPLSPLRGRQLFGLGSARFEQERFAEALALLTESAKLSPALEIDVLLVAAHAHLGRILEATEALARYAAHHGEDIAERISRLPNARQQQLCHEGLARLGHDALGRGVPETATGED